MEIGIIIQIWRFGDYEMIENNKIGKSSNEIWEAFKWDPLQRVILCSNVKIVLTAKMLEEDMVGCIPIHG